MYNSPYASVLTNGLKSAPFPNGCGTQQECPISPLFSALAIEPLAETFRCDSLVTGIVVDPQQHIRDQSIFIEVAPWRKIREGNSFLISA